MVIDAACQGRSKSLERIDELSHESASREGRSSDRSESCGLAGVPRRCIARELNLFDSLQEFTQVYVLSNVG